MSEHCCEVLNAPLVNGDALDIKEHSIHIRDWCEAVQGRRVDMEEGGMRDPK